MVEQLVTVTMLPPWLWFGFAFGFGTIFGSFLDVVVSRFHTGKSINGHSHCTSCGRRLRWFELFPIISYLAQRARCRTCGCRIPARLFMMEVVTGLLFVVALVSATSYFELGWLLIVLLLLLAITVYDYHHFIIPDEMTVALLAVVSLWLGYGWWLGELTLVQLGWAVVASLAGATFLFFLWAISRGQWLGFGDVKLAVPLGLWVGTAKVFSFITLSFWVGAGISLGILGYQRYTRGKHWLHLKQETLTMKSAVPFAPFMILGAALVYFLHIDVLSLFSFTY